MMYFYSLISNFSCVLNVVLFLLGDSLVSEFCVLTFWNTLYVIFIGGESRNNNQDEIVGKFTKEKFWLKNSLSQTERVEMGRWHV
jgi:hypothetical protein